MGGCPLQSSISSSLWAKLTSQWACLILGVFHIWQSGQVCQSPMTWHGACMGPGFPPVHHQCALSPLRPQWGVQVLLGFPSGSTQSSACRAHQAALFQPHLTCMFLGSSPSMVVDGPTSSPSRSSVGLSALASSSFLWGLGV